MERMIRLLSLLSLTATLLATNTPALQPTESAVPETHSLGVITGTVTDESSVPLAGLCVSAVDYAVVFDGGGDTSWSQTVSDGSYHIDVPAGTYLVYVNSHGDPGSYVSEAYFDVNSWSQITSATPVTVTAGQTVTSVDLSLPVGFTVRGRLVDEQGQPVLGAGANIQDTYQDIEFGRNLGFGSSDTDGTFQVNVPAGTYDLCFCKDDDCAAVLRGLEVTGHTDLGDVLFAEVPEPPRVLDPRALQPGYAAEWFVAPGAFNMPQEVLLTPQGDLLVQAVRASTLFRVADDGAVTPLATEVNGYLGDVDAQGNVYLHTHPGGLVTRVSPDGTASVVVESPEIESACDSGFGFGPDGNLYVALNRCAPTSDLFQVSLAGEVACVAQAIPILNALRTAPDGRFLAAGLWEVYELSLDDYSLTLLGRLPPGSEHVSPGGMAVDDADNIYLATGCRRPGGQVYRMDPGGQVTLVAEIPINGLSGIEWLPDTGEIVGGQVRQGGLIAVGTDGTLREIVPGNGLVTPNGMAFSPSGELAVANDDGEMMALVSSAGDVSWFFDYSSFVPPVPYLAFAPDGTLYASEGCPGCPERVLVVPPGERPRRLIDAAMPSGVAIFSDGSVLVSETSAGRIIKINPDGSTTVLVAGLDFPQALAVSIDGSVYVVTGKAGAHLDPVFPVPCWGDTIMRIAPDGGLTTVAEVMWVAGLAVGPSGDLFAAQGAGVVRISPDGRVSAFAGGLFQPMGLAFDLTGNLYASEAEGNGIACICGFPQGTLSGVVTDEAGTPINGAQVQALSDWPVVVGQVVTTGAGGHFGLPAAPRTYSVAASASGYCSGSYTGVTVTAGQTTTVSLALTRCRLLLPIILKVP